MHVHRNPRPPTTFGPAEVSSASEPVYRCDETPDLPLSIKVLLNRYYPGWSFPDVSEDDCYSVKQSGDPQAYAQLIKGDFDDDGRLDYAVLIQQGAEADDKGAVKPLIVHTVAFFRKPNGYKMHPVTSEAAGCLMLMRKGETDYDYEAEREFTYPRDTIMGGMGMGGMSYLYEYGKFRAIITSD
ncbi:MAG TPA: hypothetical protein VGJ69_10970 [Pyrinomonadaceae bacterium]|jgi:hypothetical protein